MKNRRVEITFVFLVMGVLLIAVYAYHEVKKDPHKVTKRWLLVDSKYKDDVVEMAFRYGPIYEGLDYNISYCKLTSGEWLAIRAEKGFLGMWKVIHVEEIPFEELPGWVINDLYEEDYLEPFKDWQEKHRGEWKKISYDRYASYGIICYIKLKNDQWLRLDAKKDRYGDWDIEEKEIGITPEEITESFYTWYEEGEITVAEIEKFLDILDVDGMDTTPIRDSLKAKGVPLDGEEEG